MKKNFLRSLSFVACLVSLFAFVGCDSEDDDEGGEYRVEIGVVDRTVYEAAYDRLLEMGWESQDMETLAAVDVESVRDYLYEHTDRKGNDYIQEELSEEGVRSLFEPQGVSEAEVDSLVNRELSRMKALGKYLAFFKSSTSSESKVWIYFER